MNWFKRLATLMRDDAERYFGIGHGDYNEDIGYEPNYIVWVWLYGDVLTGPKSQMRDEDVDNYEAGGTHGSLWGHENTERTYKGRYEPQTGRLSIVKPEHKEYHPIPTIVMDRLHEKFDITEVLEF